MGTRQQQKAKRRQDILETALDLFITKGYSDTRISDIAEKAGMSMGLMFYYFESKAKLYEELVRIGISGPLSMLQIDSSEPLGFFEAAAGFILKILNENSFSAKMFVLMEQAGFTAAIPETVQEQLKELNILEATVPIIEAGQACGQIRDGDPLALSVLFWQALTGVALLKALHPNTPVPEPEWLIDCLRRKQA
ncbi:MAG: TetR/AcrR family transcriptional regulator [Coriobacteriales bacterium]|jgi:AcrR family transcriptional regulator|nr:TetR/AcrR family transcriptional regulator [Coriobacteriales bacterium]